MYNCQRIRKNGTKLDFTEGSKKNIVTLDISVDNSVLMEII